MDENFANTDERKDNSKFRKIEYMKLEPGQFTIRILEPSATKKYAHFINYNSIECLEDECPVCENNRRILYEHPKDYREVKGWSPKRERFWVNVLNKTSETPVIQVLSGGPRLFEDLSVMAKATRTDEDEMVDIRAYDWILMVSGTGREREITPVPQYRGKNEPINTEEMELFDLSSPLPTVTKEEAVEFLNGTSLKDIFAMRKATQEVLKNAENSAEVEEAIDETVEELFS